MNLIQQNLRIRVLLEVLLEAVMKIQKITTCQATPAILMILRLNVNGGKKGARPKYQKVPQDDKGLPLSKLPDEKNGLPDQKGTAETSFIEEIPSGRVKNMDFVKIELAHETIQVQYPQYGKNRSFLILEVKDGKVFSFGSRGGLTSLFLADGRTLNSQLLKLKNVQETLGPRWPEVVHTTDEDLEELAKIIEEDTKIANDENEDPVVRERARERATKSTERQDQLKQEKERILEKVPLRERLKELFKKHGFTLATVVAAVGITICVIAKILADGASAAANGIKTVGKKVGDGLKELGKKIGSILPGLVGAIASFVFRAAGQAITFLGKNAWLLILFVAAFLIEKITKKRRE